MGVSGPRMPASVRVFLQPGCLRCRARSQLSRPGTACEEGVGCELHPLAAAVVAEHPGREVERLGFGWAAQIEDLATVSGGVRHYGVLAGSRHGDAVVARHLGHGGQHVAAVFFAEGVAEFVQDRTRPQALGLARSRKRPSISTSTLAVSLGG